MTDYIVSYNPPQRTVWKRNCLRNPVSQLFYSFSYNLEIYFLIVNLKLNDFLFVMNLCTLMTIKIFGTPAILAKEFAKDFKKICEEFISKNGNVNIALSGGNTPKLFFEVLSKEYLDKLDWSKISFYWVDERCVPAESNDSNYGEAERILFRNISSKKNIYPLNGDKDPENEAIRYSDLIKKNLRAKNNLPVFGLILLGMGEDGHTASIFPDQMNLLTSKKVSEVALQPGSGQKRITLTGRVINNADRIIFLVTGEGKAEVVKEILNKEKNCNKYPAAHISPGNGQLDWYLDSKAAGLIRQT